MNMHIRKVINIFIFILLLSSEAVQAQSGIENNPLMLKLHNYELIYSERKFDELEFPLSDVELITVSGDKMFATYKFNPGPRGGRHPNGQQILQTYYDNIRNLRGRPIFKGENYATFRVKSNGKEYWCVIETHINGETYTLSVVEQEQLQEADNARDMLALLNEKGELNLYIQFSTGSAQLSIASYSTINEVAKMMVYAPSIKISIEGHTDNVGAAAVNKQLSLERAESVKAALVKKGTDPKRLSTKGWGSEKPIANNNEEKGRLKNRRVVIKKVN